jgi:hypothetical protein
MTAIINSNNHTTRFYITSREETPKEMRGRWATDRAERRGWNAQARGAKVAALGVASPLRGVETGRGGMSLGKEKGWDRERHGLIAKEGKGVRG